MFLFIFFSSLVKSEMLGLSKTFVVGNILTTFDTEISLRCVNFDKKIADQLNFVIYADRSSLHKINVVHGDQEVHQTFKTKIDVLNLNFENTRESIKNAIQNDYDRNPALVVIYAVAMESKYPGTSRVIAKGDGWIAMGFGKDEIVYENSKIIYLIVDALKQLLTDIFDHPLNYRPLNNFTHEDDINVISYTKDSEDSSISSQIQKDFAKYTKINISNVPYESESLDIICGICEDADCVKHWLQQTSEYHFAQIIRYLAVFSLPRTCPPNFVYGDDTIAFAPQNDKESLKMALSRSLFGFDSLGESLPFAEMVIRRNSIVFPFADLVSNFSFVIDSVRSHISLGLEITDQLTLNALEKDLEIFQVAQRNATVAALNGLKVNEYYETASNAAAGAWTIWSTISGNIGTKRICAGNRVNLYSDNFFLFRPFAYMVISILASIIIFAYAFTRMRPKTVINLLSTPPSIL